MPTHFFKSRAFFSSAFLCSGLAAFGLALIAPAVSNAARAEGAPSVQQIIDALKPRKTRGLSVKPTQAEIERAQVIDDLRSKAATRALSVPERTQLAEAASDKPMLDLVIYFGFNSDKISPRSRDALQSLGKALEDDTLKDAAIMVAGHTDATGRSEYNQSLSERRADAVRNYLSDNFNLSKSNFTVVGYGFERLKDPAAPKSGVNRRVQIVNLTDGKTASAAQP
ncbi:membrane protein [Hyphomicrobium nitrativorans NL23]|uniref:Membrane protein n=1 Tax=Hyphomicrobium nitrativorans NL23 TaxID=1029756 RepID=V5SEJ0_9HYPH|nr:OmpA family protein [Hyphomicrobium nitrativorans]AHB48943.1 membrane protein [Hyphomicrobium nitrativorans NL23]